MLTKETKHCWAKRKCSVVWWFGVVTPLTRFLVIILNIAELQQQVELLQQTFSETFLLFLFLLLKVTMMKMLPWSVASQTTFPWSSRSKTSLPSPISLFPSPLLFFSPHSPFYSPSLPISGAVRWSDEEAGGNMAAVPKLLMGNHLMSRKHEEKWKREKEIFFKYTMHFFWMRNNLFFIILNIYMGS